MPKKIHFLLLFFVFLIAMPLFGMQKQRRQKKYEKNLKKQINQSCLNSFKQKCGELSAAQQELTKKSNELKFEKILNKSLLKEIDLLKQTSGIQSRHHNCFVRSGAIQLGKIEKLKAELVEAKKVEETKAKHHKTLNSFLERSRKHLKKEMEKLAYATELMNGIYRLNKDIQENIIIDADEQLMAKVPLAKTKDLTANLYALNVLMGTMHVAEPISPVTAPITPSSPIETQEMHVTDSDASSSNTDDEVAS
jgi:hypothetical protein